MKAHPWNWNMKLFMADTGEDNSAYESNGHILLSPATP